MSLEDTPPEVFDEAAIADVRQRLVDWKGKKSWKDVAMATGIPEGTISQWTMAKYQGDNAKIAQRVDMFFDTLAARLDYAESVPVQPGFLPTMTYEHIRSQLVWGHQGNMTTVTGAPGVGKSHAVKNYVNTNTLAWAITASPSVSTVVSVLYEIVRAMKLPNRRGLAPYDLSRAIRDHVTGRPALLAIDEAQSLTMEAVEELRAIHDETGLGIVLVGNEDVMGSSRSAKTAQLFSRVANKMNIPAPLKDDVEQIITAWGVTEEKSRACLAAIALKPGSGGLRSLTKTMKMACLIAKGMPDLETIQRAAVQLGHRVQGAKS